MSGMGDINLGMGDMGGMSTDPTMDSTGMTSQEQVMTTQSGENDEIPTSNSETNNSTLGDSTTLVLNQTEYDDQQAN